MNIWDKVTQCASDLAALGASLSLASWDQETYMPSGGIDKRAKQISVLAGIRHQMIIQELYPLLQDTNPADLTEIDQLNYQVLKKDVERSLKLPHTFVSELSEAISKAQFVWDQAKKKDDFTLFVPHLQAILDLKKQEASYYGYETEAYDALLDSFEPGLKAAWFANLFNKFIPRLQTIFEQISPSETHFSHDKIAFDQQLSFLSTVCEKLGLSADAYRQDLSSHPFCQGITPDDVRITTRLRETDILYGFYSSIHEAGHAMYELGVGKKRWGLPESEACSMAMHESQSRFWENNIARSPEFWHFCMPILQKYFPKIIDKTQISQEKIIHQVNQIQPSLIRTEADELTYHFHIWIRFELERALLSQTIQVKDLPALWNEKVKQYLGIQVKKDSQGVLQDVHWSCGLFGYFPTYSLGTLYAAQWHHFIQQENPSYHTWVKEGDFEPIRQWLSKKIWQQGRLYSAPEICKKATGEDLNPEYFLNYIASKTSSNL